MTLDQRGSRWFGLPACTTSPEGLPPSLAQHRFVLATFYVTTTLLSWTHELRTVSPALLPHLSSSISEGTLLGPLSEIWEARHSVFSRIEKNGEELLRLQAMTGLTDEQLTELVTRIHTACGGEFTSRGRPYVLGLFRSVAMVVSLLRKNVTQEFAGAIFGVSQSTVSRRWDLLRPAIGQVLAEFVPDPRQLIGAGTALVDGTICPTWDWRAVPDLFSSKAGYAGMNVQVGADLDGKLVAVGAEPVHGARHDAYAYATSGLAQALAEVDTVADLAISVSRASTPRRSESHHTPSFTPTTKNSTHGCRT